MVGTEGLASFAIIQCGTAVVASSPIVSRQAGACVGPSASAYPLEFENRYNAYHCGKGKRKLACRSLNLSNLSDRYIRSEQCSYLHRE